MTIGESNFLARVSTARKSGTAWKALEDLVGVVAGHILFPVTVADAPANGNSDVPRQ